MADKKRIMMIRPGKRFPRMSFAQPLGFLSLIAMLRRHYPDRFEFELLEQTLHDLSAEQVKQRMAAFRPDLVCFSCLSVEAGEMHELAAISKELFPEAPVWIGGPHASFFYDWELETGNVDAVCIGEGEETFIEMIAAWLEGRPFDGIPGLALPRDGKAILTPPRAPIADLDTLPLPAWDLIDFKLYGRQISMNGFISAAPWAVLFTTRACPYQCVYCHSIFGKKVRKRGIENVMAELEILVRQFGVREIHIVDDIFNLDLDRAKAICDQIVARGIKIKIAFPNGLRGDRMDRELIQKLKRAGCYAITYAVETASPRLQKRIQKNLDLEKVREVIAWTDAEKIICQAFFMLGFPGETIEEMKMTVDYAVNSRLMHAYFFTVVVYPRTGLFDLAREEYPEMDLSTQYSFFNLRYWADKPFYTRATGVDLNKIQRDAYRAFFVRPSLIARIIIRYPKNIWFLRGLYWGLRATVNSITALQMRLTEAIKKRKRAEAAGPQSRG
ncbi:MAG TPA: radical SAM protein [bacterium]|nr:radical SAM protein [bacterium]